MDKNHLKYQIINSKPLDGYHIWIQFGDGLEGAANLSDLLKLPAFSQAWRSVEHFNRLRIDPRTETVTWGEKESAVDVAPSSLRRRVLSDRHETDT
jgi:hypothetical protein